MSTWRRPPLSPEGVREILHEVEHGSPLTPERKATFDCARALAPLIERELEQRLLKKPWPSSAAHSTDEETRGYGSPITPERKATFDHARALAPLIERELEQRLLKKSRPASAAHSTDEDTEERRASEGG